MQRHPHWFGDAGGSGGGCGGGGGYPAGSGATADLAPSSPDPGVNVSRFQGFLDTILNMMVTTVVEVDLVILEDTKMEATQDHQE